MNMEQTEHDDAEFEAINTATTLLTHVLTAAARGMSLAKATELRRGLDSGDLDVHMTVVWGLRGMRMRASAVNAAGNGDVILDVFLPSTNDEETESSNEAGTPQSLH